MKMKKLVALLLVLMMGMASMAFAEVQRVEDPETGEYKEFELDEKGSYLWTKDYRMDGTLFFETNFSNPEMTVMIDYDTKIVTVMTETETEYDNYDFDSEGNLVSGFRLVNNVSIQYNKETGKWCYVEWKESVDKEGKYTSEAVYGDEVAAPDLSAHLAYLKELGLVKTE